MPDQLTVSEAVVRRMSVRKFLPKPVARATIEEILMLASRAPSGGNVQPWRVDGLAGDALEAFKEKVGAQLMSGEAEPAQYEIYPANLWEPHRSYRFKVGEDMYAAINVPREDKMGRMAQLAENFTFFGAPVGLFFSLHEKMGPPQWSDMGMLMQTIMLLAQERGLDTCAQEAWSRYPVTIREFCAMPAEMVVFCGMAIGYRDESHPINKLRSDRAPLDAFAHLKGF